MILISGQNNAINNKNHYDFFMHIKRSKFLEDGCKLSSFSLKTSTERECW